MSRLLFILITCPLLAGAQPPYPQNYFRNPLDIPIFLAGNFGECRPGHFHSGVDIKTLGAENQPVHAAAEGYVSRIKMESGGFGHGLYITHPNGYTTLYAHLNLFAPAIQKYVVAQQYAQKRWNVDLQLPPDKFPVKKGDLVAWSGNSGASTAPHLHFEIRNTKTEHPLNPELFGLPIKDSLPPVPAEVVFFSKDHYRFVSETITPGTPLRQACPLRLKGSVYVPYRKNGPQNTDLDTVDVTSTDGFAGIGINVDDYMEGSDNTIAFYKARLTLDDTLQAEVTLDNIGYDETRYINAYADYPSRQADHKWVQCLFKLPGNHLDGIFTYLNYYKGYLYLADGRPHKTEIAITDDRGNTAVIRFWIRNRPGANTATTPCTVYTVNQPASYDQPDIHFAWDESMLYDNLCGDVQREKAPELYSDRFTIGDARVPLHRYFELFLKPSKPVPLTLYHKIALIYSDGEEQDGRGAVVADGGWYKAKVRNLGRYWLDVDTIPPVIKPLQKNKASLAKDRQIAFEVRDAMTSVQSFSGYLDGKWICFEQHSNRFFYNFDGHCGKGKHTLVFTAADENGNESRYTLNFVR